MKQRFLNLTIIHLAMCMGLATSVGVFFFVVSPDAQLPADQKQIFLMVSIAVAGSSAMAAFFLPNVMLAKHRLDKPDTSMEPITPAQMTEMFTAYQSAKIIQWASVEGAGLMAGIFFFLSGDLQFIGIAVTMAALLVFFRPSRGDFTNRLGVPGHRLPPSS